MATSRLLQPNAWLVDGRFYSLTGCPSCGCLASWPIPDAETLTRHYRENFNYAWYRDHWPAKYADAKRRLFEVSPWLGKRVLDYGGGLGYLSRAARKLGHDSLTIDPYQGLATADAGWDTLFALHVLEHAPDPAASLHEMRRLLANDGTLILAVPNAAGAGYRLMGRDWIWFQAPITHIFHFTPQAIARLVVKCGFDLVGMSFHDRWDASTAADIERATETRQLETDWLVADDQAARSKIAWRNTRRRFRALASRTDLAQDNSELAEILVIARRRD